MFMDLSMVRLWNMKRMVLSKRRSLSWLRLRNEIRTHNLVATTLSQMLHLDPQN